MLLLNNRNSNAVTPIERAVIDTNHKMSFSINKRGYLNRNKNMKVTLLYHTILFSIFFSISLMRVTLHYLKVKCEIDKIIVISHTV